MKDGKTIIELAQEVDRQSKVKRDFLVPTKQLSMTSKSSSLKFEDNLFHVSNVCHGQIASRLKIPKQYYDRMLVDSPELLSTNVNHWFYKTNEVRMIRTLDSKVRAFLSERYRPLDNYDLLTSVLPIIQEKQCDVVSTDVTENKLYLKVLFPKIKNEVKVGDVVQGGLVISNSEIGLGSLKVEPLIYRLVCSNGMITGASMRKYHVGRGNNIENIQEVLTDRTKQITDKAFWLQVQDVVRSSMSVDIFNANVEKLKESTDRKIVGNPVKAIEVTKKTFGLSETQGSSIMKHLISGSDLSQWGLANAVTRTANDEDDYDKATDLERLGGQIIELNQRDWKTISEAA